MCKNHKKTNTKITIQETDVRQDKIAWLHRLMLLCREAIVCQRLAVNAVA